nr:Glu-tRNA(Gln) amidotransferase GatDE subunit E [Nanoarchaeum sp.]
MDYEKIQFKAGLEIHQQLESHKLFCSCPSELRDDPHDILIKRKLRAVAGEEGEVDIAAEFENLKHKDFIYEGYTDSTCLVEFDEEPPHTVNQDALDTVLQICKLTNCKIVDEVQIMRKNVIDGSNTSGFQRTMLVGYDGKLETSKGIVRIDSICLEEDSARKINDKDNSVTYRLDRLGIPLIEIGTKPDIKNAEHCKETAELIGMILRSTGKVKRGLGTIRQDVNVSVKNGARVEIKGFQDLRSMPRIIEYEVERQLKGDVKQEVRKANPDGATTFLRPIPGASRMYPETDIKPIVIDKQRLDKIKLPELIDEKILRYEKEGLSSELARSFVKSGLDLEDYDYKLDKTLIASVLIEIPKDLKARYNVEYEFKEEEFRFILEALEKNKINKSAVNEIMLEISQGKKVDLGKFTQVDSNKLEEEIKKIVHENKNLTDGALMGIIMKKFSGKVDGKLVASLVAKYKK